MFDPQKVPAYLRTVVPALWGAGLTMLLSVWTAMPEWIHTFLSNDTTYTAVTGLVVLLWYSLWRWLEPRMPAWLTRILLGSNYVPTYPEAPTQ